MHANLNNSCRHFRTVSRPKKTLRFNSNFLPKKTKQVKPAVVDEIEVEDQDWSILLGRLQIVTLSKQSVLKQKYSDQAFEPKHYR